MSGVPLNAMCSIMCASPVSSRGSWAEPASTSVKNENTGASGRRHRTTVSPLGKVFTETRFSYDDKSCAASGKAAASQSRQISLANQRFIAPPSTTSKLVQINKLRGTDEQVKRREATAKPRSSVDCAQKHENPANRPGHIPQNLFPFALSSFIIAHFWHFRTPLFELRIRFIFL